MKGKPVVEKLVSAIGEMYYEGSRELWASYQSSIGKLNKPEMGVILKHAVERHNSLKGRRFGSDSCKTLYDIIESLLAHGADPNQEVDGKYSLNDTEELKVMRLLLEHGADPNKFSDSCHPALMKTFRRPEEIKLLLDAGADPNARTDCGYTALRAASNCPKSLQMLLNARADPNQRDAEGQTVIMGKYLDPQSLKVLLKGGADPNARDKRGRTPLMFVSEAESAKALKVYGADFGARDDGGRTVLMHALSVDFQKSKTIAAIIEAGATVNAVDEEGNNALSLEPFRGTHSRGESDTGFIDLLLKSGADPNLPNKKGVTPLMYWAGNAQHKECRKVVDLLLKHGADIQRTDNQGLDALMHAAKSHNQRVIKLLLSKKADPTRTSKNGRSCIEWALSDRKLPEVLLIESLLDGGASINGSRTSRKSKLNLLGNFLLGSDLGVCMSLLKRGAKVQDATLHTMGISSEELRERVKKTKGVSDPASPLEKLVAFARLDPAIFIQAIGTEDEGITATLKELALGESQGKDLVDSPLELLEPVNWPPYAPERNKVVVDHIKPRHVEPFTDFTEDEYDLYANESKYNYRLSRTDEETIELITKKIEKTNKIAFTDLLKASNETLATLWNDLISQNASLVHLRSYRGGATSGSRISIPEFRFLLTRCGPSVIPGMLEIAKKNKDSICRLLLPVSDTRIAPLMANRLINTPGSRAAENWLSRHWEAAIEGLIPIAVGPLTDARNDCEAALRYLAFRGFGKQIQQSANRYGATVRKSIGEILSVNRRLDYPRQKPVEFPEEFFGADICRPVLLSTGEMLPDRCLPVLCGMMALSTYDSVYPDLREVKTLFEPESLADFAWSVFQFWFGPSEGRYSYDRGEARKSNVWAFHSLAYFGNDRTVKPLASLIYTWPKKQGMNKAVTGLDILANIGTDTAIRTINSILLKTKYKPLLNRGGEIMATIADVRGLTKEQLDDRLVPTLDLDESGTMTLDFGPRRFHVQLDEKLKAILVDSSGKIIKALPRAAKDDNKKKVSEATASWKAFKAELRTEASTQLLRLERAMLEERRWTGADFKTLLAGHPLLRHVVSSLVWAEYDDDKPKKMFRVDKDGTYHTNSDKPFELGDTAMVGIPHPLFIQSHLKSWFECLARHKIKQAFPQVGRQCFVPKEDRDGKLFGIQGGKVPTKAFRGLKAKGWEPGIGSAGLIWSFKKKCSGGTVDLEFDGVVSIRDEGMDEDEQTISVNFPKTLSGVEYSELVRELKELLH